jgi:hypothetical protein
VIKSIKSSNNSFAKVGNVQIQPVSDSTRSDDDKPIRSKGVLQASETIIDTKAFKTSPDGSLVSQNVSLASTISSLSNDDTFFVPSLHTVTNVIAQTYRQQPKSQRVVARQPQKRLQPIERLTGLSTSRPEIVMLTDFLPLFNVERPAAQKSQQTREAAGIDSTMTAAGQFVDTHMQARALRTDNVVKTMRTLRRQFEPVNREFKNHERTLLSGVEAMKAHANFLYDLVKSLDGLKKQLDLRDDIHTIDPQESIRSFKTITTNSKADSSNHPMRELARRYIPVSYTPSDVLIGYGFRSKNIQKFSSTKIWLQTLSELKNVVRFHSLEFLDNNPTRQKNDDDPTVIIKNENNQFGFADRLINPSSLTSIQATQPNQISLVVNQLDQTFRRLFKNVTFRSREVQIAALLNLISKEFRYSIGLTSPAVFRALNGMGYATQQNGNEALFDFVIGEIGSNINDVSKGDQGVLVNVAQRSLPNNAAVLTFETNFIENEAGTTSPGATFFVDRSLNVTSDGFDTSGLDEVSELFETAHRQVSIVFDGLNVLGTIDDDSDTQSMNYSSILASPIDLVNKLIKQMVDVQTGLTLPLIRNDNLGAVYAAAASDNKLKTLLFLFTVVRILSPSQPQINVDLNALTVTSNGSPTQTELIERIISSLSVTTPTSPSNTQTQTVSAYSLTRESIRSSMKSGTNMTRLIEAMMSEMLASFRSGAFNNAATRYSGVQDTVVLMTIFDVVLQLVTKFGDQKIVSINSGNKNDQNTLTFKIIRTNLNQNHRVSINELTSRLEKEVALTQKTVFATLNTLRKISASFKGQSDYLQSRDASTRLSSITSIIKDQSLLQMLMNEQQINLLVTSVNDLASKLRTNSPPRNSSNLIRNRDEDDDVKLLDESTVSETLRDAVYGMLKGPEFASRKGFNKKVLTVGIPNGFSSKLKQRINLLNLKRTSFFDKQSDVINVAVYKVDIQNSDIIYRPKRFLFELSRFPVRDDALFLDIPDNPKIDDIVSAFPTRDFDDGTLRGKASYWSNGKSIRAKSVSFTGESYTFLTKTQQAELARNHVMSYLLEVYVRLLTGLNLAEHSFDMINSPRPNSLALVKLLSEYQVQYASDIFSDRTNDEKNVTSNGILFSSTILENSNKTHFAQTLEQKTLVNLEKSNTTAANLNNVSTRNSPVLMHGLRTVSNAANIAMSVSSPESLSQKLLTPKQFDRVFNVVIDPDDFEVDYDRTVATEHGKQALQQLIKSGDVVSSTENDQASRLINGQTLDVATSIGRSFSQGRIANERIAYRFRDRDRTQGDLTFEKYFVTIETFGEETI